MKPADAAIQAKFQQALALHKEGKLAEAERLYQEVLQRAPKHFDALHLLGVIAVETGRSQRGADLIKSAIALNPKVAMAHSNLGRALSDLKRFKESLSSNDRAIALKPDYALAHYNRGVALMELGRAAEALASYDKAIRLSPDIAEFHNNRGNALLALKRPEEALASCQKAIALKRDYPEAHTTHGSALRHLQRHSEALASYDKAIALKPDYAEAHNNRGSILKENLKRPADALASYDRAIALKPNSAEFHANRGDALTELKRSEEALSSYDRAIELNPDHELLYGTWLYARMKACQWTDLDSQIGRLIDKIKRSETAAQPFVFLAMSESPSLHRRVAESFVKAKCPPNPALPKIAKRPRPKRIRIGYFSADFREHPVAALAVELFEKHARQEFEVIAFSMGTDTNDDMIKRLKKAFDQFIDVQAQSDREVALLARDLEIDIAVDLGGFTEGSRTNIFAMRAAPIQVNYLGYPGTMGADYFDYVIADPTLIPETNRRHFSEKIIYLPNSYQANDTKRLISDKKLTRAAAGLPQDGFVFCCFNNNHKITPEVFGCWMDILKRVDTSVLWLLEDSAMARRNLQSEAERRGVAAGRLIFAGRVPLPEHLARQRLADLFLDTLPYNAHTTASDALWAGLPLLTCRGEAFAGRVAASLLNAVGLPELIASTPQAYEDGAVELATDPALIGEIRRKLADNRLTTPLFDSERFARHIEAAYRSICARYWEGLPPDHIYVPQ